AASAVWIDVGLVMFTGIYGLAQMSTVGAALSYNRDEEREAELYGLQLLAASGYDPGGAPRLWTAIAEERALDASKESRNPVFATHPTTEGSEPHLRMARHPRLGLLEEPDGEKARRQVALAAHQGAVVVGGAVEAVVAQVTPQVPMPVVTGGGQRHPGRGVAGARPVGGA